VNKIKTLWWCCGCPSSDSTYPTNHSCTKN